LPFLAAITQPDWIAALRTQEFLGEVNFWCPGLTPLSSKHYGLPFLFVQKGKSPRRIAGLGTVDRYEQLTIRAAWIRWRKANGVSSLDEFVKKARRVVQESKGHRSGGVKNPVEGDQSSIGCIILRNVVFFPQGSEPTVEQVLPDFSPRVVRYKCYEDELPDMIRVYVEQAATSPSLPHEWNWPVDVDVEEKNAIEAHAMQVCMALFPDAEVLDVSKPALADERVGTPYPGYDLVIRRGMAEYHIEVKGTKHDTPHVTLTRNELQVAANDPLARLVVVRSIRTYRNKEGWQAIGGIPTLYRWAKPGRLREILQAAHLGEVHGLHLSNAEWNLDVHNSDLLAVVPTIDDGC